MASLVAIVVFNHLLPSYIIILLLLLSITCLFPFSFLFNLSFETSQESKTLDMAS